MKIYAVRVFLLAFILLFTCAAEAGNMEQKNTIPGNIKTSSSPVGKWTWENNSDDPSKPTFNLAIESKGNKLVGKYCCISSNGDKIDCSDKNNFSLATQQEKIFIVNFKTDYGGAAGTAKITLMDDKLHWKLIKDPVGGKGMGDANDFFCPRNAVMIKDK